MRTDPLIFPTCPRGRGTLKANLLQAFGPDHLRFTDVPDPSPGPGEVMIRVVASGVNPVDYYTVTGMRNVSPMPHIPGVEVAGEVVKVGQGVQGVEPGRQGRSLPEALRRHLRPLPRRPRTPLSQRRPLRRLQQRGLGRVRHSEGYQRVQAARLR